MRAAQLPILTIAGVEIREGSRVRLRPRGPGDALDFSLAGKMATIESIERDCEGKVHFAVILGEDRRLFFDSGEIDPLV